MTFAKKLKAERKRLGLTQVEAAKLLSISTRTLEMWERGEGSEPERYKQIGVMAVLKEREGAK